MSVPPRLQKCAQGSGYQAVLTRRRPLLPESHIRPRGSSTCFLLVDHVISRPAGHDNELCKRCELRDIDERLAKAPRVVGATPTALTDSSTQTIESSDCDQSI